MRLLHEGTGDLWSPGPVREEKGVFYWYHFSVGRPFRDIFGSHVSALPGNPPAMARYTCGPKDVPWPSARFSDEFVRNRFLYHFYHTATHHYPIGQALQ